MYHIIPTERHADFRSGKTAANRGGWRLRFTRHGQKPAATFRRTIAGFNVPERPLAAQGVNAGLITKRKAARPPRQAQQIHAALHKGQLHPISQIERRGGGAFQRAGKQLALDGQTHLRAICPHPHTAARSARRHIRRDHPIRR